jgi:CDP-paratose 2-epimerase
MSAQKHVLVTGGAGFVGSNLADALLADGERVVVADNFSRAGVRLNAQWLRQRHGSRVRIETLDVRDAGAVRAVVDGAKAVYHFAAQVAVTTSLVDPRDDLETNVHGTFNVLEAARAQAVPPPVVFTSTNKVYGGLDDVPVTLGPDGRYAYADGRPGIAEDAPLDFHSPYGCSKGAADQYVHDYARIFGVPTVVFRMSCIYGTRQFGTEDQGWVAHFARALLRGEGITLFGDGCQVRDVLWVDDLVRALREAVRRIDAVAGEVFNVGGGPANAVSVAEVIARLGEITGVEVPVARADWRPGDQRIYVSDPRKAERLLGWRPETPWRAGLSRLVEWLEGAELDAVPAAAPAEEAPDIAPVPARAAGLAKVAP